MAQKMILVDDLDGSERDVATILFSVDGDSYEIDLSPSNLARLRKAVRPFTTAARQVGDEQPLTAKGRGGGRRDDGRAARIRAWANDNGFDLPALGRIRKRLSRRITRRTAVTYIKARGSAGLAASWGWRV